MPVPRSRQSEQSTRKSVDSDGRQRARWLLIIVLVVGVFWRLPTLFDPPWVNDEGTYAAVGHLLQAGPQGSLLYSTIWENKPPAIYLLYAIADALGGPAHLLLLVRLASLIAVLGIQVLLFRLGQAVGGMDQQKSACGLLAAMLAGIALHLPIIEGTTANAEVFLAVFVLAAMALILDATWISQLAGAFRYLFAGLLLGLALQFKLVAAGDTLAALLLVATQDHRWMATWVAVGALLPGAIVLGVFASHGPDALHNYLYATIGYNLGYAGAGNSAGQTGLPVALLVKAAIPLLATLTWIWTRRHPRPAWRNAGALVLWGGWACAGAQASGRLYPHYAVQIVAPLCCLLGLLLTSWAVQRITASVAGLLGATSLALVCITILTGHNGPGPTTRQTMTTPLAYYALVWWHWTGQLSAKQFVAALDPHAAQVQDIAALLQRYPLYRPGKTLFVWGNRPWLYTLTGLDDPTPLTSTYYRPAIRGELTTIEQAFYHAPPAALVLFQPLTPAAPAPLQAFWASHYQFIGRAGNALIYWTR